MIIVNFKFRIKIWHLLLPFFFTNCKDKSEIMREEFTFNVQLNLKVVEDDFFEVFYTDLNSKEGFTETKKVRKKIIGKDSFQNIQFDLNKTSLSKFRIDFGENKNQKDIILKNIIIKRNQDSIEIKNDVLHRFFQINKFLEWDKKGRLKIKEINKKRDPFIVSSSLLIKKIQLEL